MWLGRTGCCVFGADVIVPELVDEDRRGRGEGHDQLRVKSEKARLKGGGRRAGREQPAGNTAWRGEEGELGSSPSMKEGSLFFLLQPRDLYGNVLAMCSCPQIRIELDDLAYRDARG